MMRLKMQQLWTKHILRMILCVTFVKKNLEEKLVLRNIFSQSVKKSNIPVINVTNNLLNKQVSKHIFSLSMKESSIHVIFVHLKPRHREVCKATYVEYTEIKFNRLSFLLSIALLNIDISLEIAWVYPPRAQLPWWSVNITVEINIAFTIECELSPTIQLSTETSDCNTQPAELCWTWIMNKRWSSVSVAIISQTRDRICLTPSS